jgi:anti-sigma regulatory factor (Ser/Thr protein kinase)
MRDLSLHILDLAQNSVRAGAKLVEITLSADIPADRLAITIRDDGCGMTPEFLAKVRSPFSTTRTTRKVGLGIPMMEERAALAGGGIDIASEVGVGTTFTAWMKLRSIDRPPLGDMAGTVLSLILLASDNINFIARAEGIGEPFVLDTREVREALGDVPISGADAAAWLAGALAEGFEAYKAIDRYEIRVKS